MPKEVCEVTLVHEEAVIKVQNQMPDLSGVAKFLKALSDETRLKIAFALTVEDELCVCDVASIIGSSVATASHHLRLLRNLGLAKYRKEGKLVFYSLDDDHVRQLIQIAFTHQLEGKTHG